MRRVKLQPDVAGARTDDEDSPMTMTAVDAAVFHQIQEPRFWFRDVDTHARVVFTNPRTDPTLWNRFLDGALLAYGEYGVTSALDYRTISDGLSTSRFVAVLDARGTLVAGLRIQGPYGRASESHAVTEWTDARHRALVREMVADRIAQGVIEVKAVWVSRDAGSKEQLSALIGRCVVHVTRVMGVRHAMLTTAEHAMGLYRAVGASPALHIPPTPYPSEQYKTFLMWWDTTELPSGIASDQLRRMRLEWAAIESRYALFATFDNGHVGV